MSLFNCISCIFNEETATLYFHNFHLVTGLKTKNGLKMYPEIVKLVKRFEENMYSDNHPPRGGPMLAEGRITEVESSVNNLATLSSTRNSCTRKV